VSGLPRPLSPWAALLSPLADDLQLGLGEWARRIAAALGPHAVAHVAEGEPDGVAGLTRRGPYDRLLLTEWLLARELPDEFTRRAVMGEHLFLERGRRSRGAGRGVVALVDAGPDQLGAPRIAQLAALVVLAARAEAAQVGFSWGALQAPAAGLHPGFAEDEVRRFLAARSRIPVTADLAAAWAGVAALQEAELWLLGGETLAAALPLPASRIVVEELVTPRERTVRLGLQPRGRGRREVTLPLPAPPACTRLLRDPFRFAALPPAESAQAEGVPRLPGTIDPRGGILFAPFGARAAVRLADGSVLDLHVPGSGSDRAGRTRRWVGGELIAIGWLGRGKRFAVRGVRNGGAVLESPWGTFKLNLTQGAPNPVASGPGEALLPCHQWPRSGAPGRCWFLDGRRTLYVAMPGQEPASVVASDVAAIASGEVLAFVSLRGGTAELQVHRGPAERFPAERFRVGKGTGRVFLGCSAWGVFGAIEGPQGWPWRMFMLAGSEFTSRPLQPFPDTEVVGVIYQGAPALLLLEADRTTFTVLRPDGAKTVHQSTTPVVAAAVDAAGVKLGYITAASGLAVHEVSSGSRLLQRRFEERR